MSDAEQGSQGETAFDPFAEARIYGEHYGIERREGEEDVDYRSRVAGELRKQGRIVEAHEAASGRRWDDPEQGDTGPMAGITGAVAQALQGAEYSPHDPERQVGDDIAAGVVATGGSSQAEDTIAALFGVLGVEGGMDVIDAFTRPNGDTLPQS